MSIHKINNPRKRIKVYTQILSSTYCFQHG